MKFRLRKKFTSEIFASENIPIYSIYSALLIEWTLYDHNNTYMPTSINILSAILLLASHHRRRVYNLWSVSRLIMQWAVTGREGGGGDRHDCECELYDINYISVLPLWQHTYVHIQIIFYMTGCMVHGFVMIYYCTLLCGCVVKVDYLVLMWMIAP